MMVWKIGICRGEAQPLSLARTTDEVCRNMLRFEGVSGEFVTFSTSSDRPSGGHLEVNCPEGAREAALGRPLKRKALALPCQCSTSSNFNLSSNIFYNSATIARVFPSIRAKR